MVPSFFFLLLVVFSLTESAPITINTYLGNGSPSSNGDGNPPSGATVNYPSGLAYDACSSTLYFSDNTGNRVRTVKSALVGAFAGTGLRSSTGDLGPALSATLNAPEGLAVAPDGSLFIVEQVGNRLRLVTPDGRISTAAGNGEASSLGDGGPASAATLNYPGPVVISPGGDVIISEVVGCRIRRIDAASGFIYTIIGNGVCTRTGDAGPAVLAQMFGSAGLAFDSKGSLLFSEYAGPGCGVRKIDTKGIVTTVVGVSASCSSSGDGGQALQGTINQPLLIFIDSADNLFIADHHGPTIRFVNSSSGVISTIAGQTGLQTPLGDGGAATSATLKGPGGFIILPDKTGLISDSNGNRIRSLSTLPFGPGRYASMRVCPTIDTYLGNGAPTSTGNGGPPGSATINVPTGMAFDICSSTLYLSDRYGNFVRSVRNAIVAVFAGTGVESSSGDLSPAVSATLDGPDGLAVAPDGSVYIIECDGNRLRLVAPNGIISTVAGTGDANSNGDGGPASAASINSPRRVAISPSGDLIISEAGGCRLRRIDASSGFIYTIIGNGTCARSGDTGLAALAQMGWGYGLAFDSQGNLFFSEYIASCRVRKIDTQGVVTTVVGASANCSTTGDGGQALQATIYYPNDIYLDSADNLFIADDFGFVLRFVSRLTGTISTIAGRVGLSSPLNDGGAATSATLYNPVGIIILPDSTALISDANNNRIRSLSTLPFGPAMPLCAFALPSTRTSEMVLARAPEMEALLALRLYTSPSM